MWGSIISGGLSLAGSLLAGKQKAPSGPTLEEQYNANLGAQLNAARQLPEAQAEGWRKAGIHPLAGLGVSAPSVPGFASIGQESSTDNRWGNALESMGQGVSRAAAAYASREERDMARASGLLQIENQQLQNDRLRSEIALMHSPGTPPGLSTAGNDGDARYPTQAHMPLGFGDSAPLLRKSIDRHGNTMDVYNDDLGDNEILQALTAAGVSVPQWMANNIIGPMINANVALDKKFSHHRRLSKAKAEARYRQSKPKWSRYHLQKGG